MLLFWLFYWTGNLVSKKKEEAQELKQQVQIFTDSVASQMQEISFRDQVDFTDYLIKVLALHYSFEYQ